MIGWLRWAVHVQHVASSIHPRIYRLRSLSGVNQRGNSPPFYRRCLYPHVQISVGSWCTYSTSSTAKLVRGISIWAASCEAGWQSQPDSGCYCIIHSYRLVMTGGGR